MKQEKHGIKLKQGSDFDKIVPIKPGTKPKGIMDFLGCPPETIDGMYRHAYQLYNTGRYKDAAQVFRTLTTLHTSDYKYTMGLAACYHMMKEYQMAAGVYLVVSTLAPLNPIPYFHASDCYMQIGDKVSAMLMLEMALKKAGSNKEYSTLKQRAEITLAGLKKELFKKS